MYINDISNGVNSSMKLFADDCVVFRRIDDSDNRTILQEDGNSTRARILRGRTDLGNARAWTKGIKGIIIRSQAADQDHKRSYLSI